MVEAVEVSPNGLALSVGARAGAQGLVWRDPRRRRWLRAPSPTRADQLQLRGDELGRTAKVAFTRATGLFKGAFNVYRDYVSADDLVSGKQTWLHTVKKASYEGLLTPVPQAPRTASRGKAFLSGRTRIPMTSRGGLTVSVIRLWFHFAFNGSYDFLLFAN